MANINLPVISPVSARSLDGNVKLSFVWPLTSGAAGDTIFTPVIEVPPGGCDAYFLKGAPDASAHILTLFGSQDGVTFFQLPAANAANGTATQAPTTAAAALSAEIPFPFVRATCTLATVGFTGITLALAITS